MNRLKFYLLLPLLGAFLVVGIWDIYWMTKSTKDYYRRLSSQAEQLFKLRQEPLILSMLTGEEQALREEGESFKKMFHALKEVSFYLHGKNLYLGRYFQPSRTLQTNRPGFGLILIYPLYLDDLFVGNVYFDMKEDSFHTGILLGALFFFIVFTAFVIGLFLTFKNLNLEKIVKEQAQEMNRHMAYIVHELKNPLTAINNLSYILRKYSKEENTIEVGKRIGGIAVDLEEKINYLLNLARIDFKLMKQNSRRLALKPLVDEYIEKFSYLILDKELSLNNFVDESVEITASPEMMEILLSNLLSNAIKYTPAGAVNVRTLDRSGRTYLLVEDTGIGIPILEQEKVFEMFYRTEHSQKVEKGTGVGLYLTRKLVHEMGWEIQVESPILPNGKGSRISVMIPEE